MEMQCTVGASKSTVDGLNCTDSLTECTGGVLVCRVEMQESTVIVYNPSLSVLYRTGSAPSCAVTVQTCTDGLRVQTYAQKM